MKRLAGLAIVAMFAVVGAVRADENPTGTWKWSVEVNGQKRETTLKLKLEDGKLSGAMLGRMNAETKIEEGSFKDGEVKFNITRERNGQKSTTKYSGKISGDTFKGTAESERGGQARKTEFEAKRSKD